MYTVAKKSFKNAADALSCSWCFCFGVYSGYGSWFRRTRYIYTHRRGNIDEGPKCERIIYAFVWASVMRVCECSYTCMYVCACGVVWYRARLPPKRVMKNVFSEGVLGKTPPRRVRPRPLRSLPSGRGRRPVYYMIDGHRLGFPSFTPPRWYRLYTCPPIHTHTLHTHTRMHHDNIIYIIRSARLYILYMNVFDIILYYNVLCMPYKTKCTLHNNMIRVYLLQPNAAQKVAHHIPIRYSALQYNILSANAPFVRRQIELDLQCYRYFNRVPGDILDFS